MKVSDIITICIAAIGFLGSWTLLVYKVGVFTSMLNANTALILEVRNIVINQDDRIGLIEKDIIELKTKCIANHKE